MIIFLDIDGVMVPAKGWKRPELLEDSFPAFSTRAVNALKSLLSKEDTVMLTTSHKSNIGIEEWKKIFAKRGLPADDIKALPHNAFYLSRKDEIMQWFAVNGVPNEFVIIDDDTSLNDLPNAFKNKLILTSPYIGLTEEHLAGVRATQQ